MEELSMLSGHNMTTSYEIYEPTREELLDYLQWIDDHAVDPVELDWNGDDE